MRFCSFASGSSGNCEYIGNGQTNIILDAGISAKRIVNGLEEVNAEPEKLDGILITHEHSDHIKGLVIYESKYNVPLYATEETLKAIERYDKDKRIDTSLFRPVKPDREFFIGNLSIKPFSTSHDARDSVCYTISDGNVKIGMATDLGMYDNYVISHLIESDLLFIEANYDVAMLQAGKYPFSLKKRILSEYGHLSNDMSAKLILQLLNRKVKHVFLAHLSKENNYPELAYESVKYDLKNEYGNISMFDIRTADRDSISCNVML